MISIITPVFNGESYIEKCIRNVIEQACSNVEHIIVDGNSSDGTIEIIKTYASRYHHLHWISEKDRGQVDALNKGVRMSKHPILGLLNVDDYYELGVLNRVLHIFNTLPEPSLIAGNCNVWNADGTLQYVNKPSSLRFEDLMMGWEFFPHPVNPVAYFYHKSVHDLIGPYDEKFGAAHDLAFVLNSARLANTQYYDELWGNWRKLEGTTTVQEQKSDTAALRYWTVMNSFYDRYLKRDMAKLKMRQHYMRSKRRIRGVFRMLAGAMQMSNNNEYTDP